MEMNPPQWAELLQFGIWLIHQWWVGLCGYVVILIWAIWSDPPRKEDPDWWQKLRQSDRD